MAGIIDYILFDLDGTLADTGPDLAGALNLLLREEGRESLPYEMIRPLVSHGGLTMISSCLGIPVDSIEMRRLHGRFLEIYQTRLAEETDLFPGMNEVLTALEAMALPWGIVTNKPGFLTTPLISALRLDHRTACVVSGDTLEYSKPHPAPLLHACQAAGCAPSRSLYIGDARRDIEAGLNAGMYTLVALYGYLGAEDRPETWGAAGMIQDPAGVLTWLEKLQR
ncbi:MAG TPA: HAD-IA family hydrolase [Gammaproteobacteria bacterium]|nr:HAD-IA family hydrolase [Gammaproteobacteria bacterium]